MSDDEKAVRFFSFKRRWEAATAALKIVEEEAKASLGKHAIRDIRTSISLDTPEGEAKQREKLEAQLRVARWLGLAIGSQANFLDEDEDRTPAVDRAAAEGKRDGLAGNPCKPAYDPSTPQYASYMEKYHEGQATMVKAGIKAPPDGDDDRDLRPGFMQRAEAEKAGGGAIGTQQPTHKIAEASTTQ
jgi:hypothetical protein